jgi:hypothetical protein
MDENRTPKQRPVAFISGYGSPKRPSIVDCKTGEEICVARGQRQAERILRALNMAERIST